MKNNNTYTVTKPLKNLADISFSLEQKEQLTFLHNLIQKRDVFQLSLFLQKQNVLQDDLYQTLNDDCWTYFLNIQHLMSAHRLIVCFTFIYNPARDPEHFAFKDASDLLDSQNNLVINVSIHKSQLTKEHLKSMVIFANLLHMDFYMSNAQFKSFKRTSDNLFSIQTLTIDLDTYKVTDKDGSHPFDDEEQDNFFLNESTFESTTADKKLLNRINPILKRLGISYHTFVNSGHGRYLIFQLDSNVNLSRPEMKLLYTTVLKALIEKIKQYGADAHCSDIGHLYRVPGNINTKTGRMSYITKITEQKINLSDLADKLGYKKREKLIKTLNLEKKKTYAVTRTEANSRYTKVNMQRKEDLETLISLRKYDIKGHRDQTFLIMGINCFFMGMEEQEIRKYMKEINTSLKEPYENIETIIAYAKKNYEKFLKEPDKAVKYKNKEIVKMLEITSKEQKKMKQLISEKEANKRQKEFVKRNNEKKSKEKKEIKQQLIEDMKYLRYRKLLKNKEIAEQLNTDVRTVTKLIGKDPKFITIGRRSTKEMVQYYVKLGYSNLKIANLLNINERYLIKMKK